MSLIVPGELAIVNVHSAKIYLGRVLIIIIMYCVCYNYIPWHDFHSATALLHCIPLVYISCMSITLKLHASLLHI